MTIRTLIRLMIVLTLVGACTGGDDGTPLELEVIQSVQSSIVARRAARQGGERPPLRRADLDTVDGSFIEVTVERRDQLATLILITQRDDPVLGRISVWRTGDNATITTRNGVLIATRGLGGDLISSSVQTHQTQPGPATGGEHVQWVRALDNRELQVSFACTLENLGAETIVIVERKHPTQHLQQRCEGGGGQIVNDYWVDRSNGLIWQSKQWAGPNIGYLKLRRLTK